MIGSIITITPIVGWSLPALFPIVTAVAGYMGFVKLTGLDRDSWLQGQLTKKMLEQRRKRKVVAVPLHQYLKDVVSPELGREERLEFKKEDVILIFRKDTRGQFFIEVEGSSKYTGRELQMIINDFANGIIQQFAYNKIVKELNLRGVNVIDEEINEKGEIILQTRKWD